MSKNVDIDSVLRWNSMNLYRLTDIMDYFYQPNPEIGFNEIRDALSKGQLASKLWLLTELESYMFCMDDFDFSRKFSMTVLGGWLGTLCALCDDKTLGGFISKYTVVDKDVRCKRFAQHINQRSHTVGKFEFLDLDVFHPYAIETTRESDIVVNTSCEHFKDYSWLDTVEPGTIVVAQSNNYTGPVDHVNVCTSVENFTDKLGLSDVSYQGTMHFPNVYDRYMVIGIK